MPFRISYTPEAEAQLVALYRYIASEASPAIARSFTDTIVDRCEKLAISPHRGSPRDDLRLGLRTLAHRRRVTIAYAVEAEEVSILGIFYGGRNLEALLRED
jgi:toxin ParE1/3/4